MEDFLPKSDLYRMFTIASIAAFFGWAIFAYYKPIITEAGCSEIAAKSVNVGVRQNVIIDPNLNYEHIKIKCIEDSKVGVHWSFGNYLLANYIVDPLTQVENLSKSLYITFDSSDEHTLAVFSKLL